MVICICSCELHDPVHRGKYRGGQTYQDDTLAEAYPSFFETPPKPAEKKKKESDQ